VVAGWVLEDRVGVGRVAVVVGVWEVAERVGVGMGVLGWVEQEGEV
jgi:hypothetical protein